MKRVLIVEAILEWGVRLTIFSLARTTASELKVDTSYIQAMFHIVNTILLYTNIYKTMRNEKS